MRMSIYLRRRGHIWFFRWKFLRRLAASGSSSLLEAAENPNSGPCHRDGLLPALTFSLVFGQHLYLELGAFIASDLSLTHQQLVQSGTPNL
jgi:hypothetical protein